MMSEQSYAYVILVLSLGRSGNINNTGRMQKGVVPKNWTM